MLAGAGAGCLGALLGIGGGVFLVPVLNLGLGLPFEQATGISLVTVIATSSAVSARPGQLRFANLRLGMVLEVFTTIGGLIGALMIGDISKPVLRTLFGATTLTVSILMLSRLDRRNVVRGSDVEIGALGGRYHEDESGGDVSYRVKRLPLAFLVSLVAGFISTLAGIGGGVLKVPVLNAGCGVPIRAAAATSALMIAATAVVGAIGYFREGAIVPHLAAAAVLGVLAGSQAGFVISARTKARNLKLLMAIVLGVVAVIYFVRAVRG